MKVRKLFNITKKGIQLKKNNIWIGICLKNKFFTRGTSINEENVKKYIKWALDHTQEKVLILIADKIQATNYDVRNNNSSEYNKRKVLKEGSILKKEVKDLIKNNFKEDLDKIEVIRWEEYEENDPFCKKTGKFVWDAFDKNKEFRDQILNSVKTSVVDRKFSEEKYLKLCGYVLDEFSLCYSGLEYKGIYYGMYIYPESDTVVNFLLENIEKDKKLKEIKNKLPNKKVSLVILK